MEFHASAFDGFPSADIRGSAHISLEGAGARGWLGQSDGPHGRVGFLAPVVQMEETATRWELPTVPLGTHAAAWSEARL